MITAQMSHEKKSTLISNFVTILILIASYRQWWDIAYDGALVTKEWVKILFLICIILLLYSSSLIVYKEMRK